MRTFLKSINLNANYNLNTLVSPVIVYLKLTGCCNLHCKFCSQALLKKDIMDLNCAKKLLNDLKKLGVISINYTGGEPLVYPHIYELLKYGYSLGFEQTIVTNGVALFKQEKILDFVNTIGISLHGKPDVHDAVCNKKGTFKIVETNIDLLQKKYPKINLNINYTLSEDSTNYENMFWIKEFAKKRQIKLCFGRLNYLGLALKDNIINPNSYLEIINELKKDYNNISVSNCVISCLSDEKYKYLNHPCGAGISIFSVDANGDVKICPSSNYVLGNCFKMSFKKIIRVKELKNFYNLNWLPNCCKICKDFVNCKGGCHAEGNQKFFQNTCDSLLINKLNNSWDVISKNSLELKCNKLRKEKRDYLIIKIPIRKIDKLGYHILREINGVKTGNDLVNMFKKVDNIKDFLSSLYLDGIIGVKNEIKKN